MLPSEDSMLFGAKQGEVGCQVQGRVRDRGGATKVPEAGGGGDRDVGRAHNKGNSPGAVRAPQGSLGAVQETARGDKGGSDGQYQ